MPIADQDEWLQPGTWDEVALGALDPDGGWSLQVAIVVEPHGRRAAAVAVVGGVEAARLDGEEDGPPRTNWDRMEVGAVRWRMVEARVRWDVELGGPGDPLRGFLAFQAVGPCVERPGGYAQAGRVAGQLQVGDRRIDVASAPATRSHTWR